MQQELKYIIFYSYHEYIPSRQEYDSSEDKILRQSFKICNNIYEAIQVQFDSENLKEVRNRGFNFSFYEIITSKIKPKETAYYKKLDFDLNLFKKIQSLEDDLKEYKSIYDHLKVMLKSSVSNLIKNNYYFDQVEEIEKKINIIKNSIEKLSKENYKIDEKWLCPKCKNNAGPITDDCLTLHCEQCNFTFDVPTEKSSDKIHPAFLCNHANESPSECDCDKNCYCKFNTCKIKS